FSHREKIPQDQDALPAGPVRLPRQPPVLRFVGLHHADLRIARGQRHRGDRPCDYALRHRLAAKGTSHNYILEATDYASVLENATHIRFKYDGYSWGFTLTLKFELIEGVPPMDALSVTNIYNGYFAYGDATKPIEN